ncbi:MAG: toll/interleukin-1 receptor domain-containing protein [Acidimicrobiia bacterium]|nr:toll/interleukin-1 receptor domain-containing protein [Acidimicrobiia bacterium]MYC45814.1 toll/interleukin-1 receptor domain-containing protein [Acidimicrobiia bacterium]MYI20639.1 toll/interleukin-1 receptor domain-containing protein [Acidimicrobiia bacterium]
MAEHEPTPSRAIAVEPRGPVFISYRHSDARALAESLAWALRAAGVPVWHDVTDLPPGDTDRRLGEALASGLSGAVVIVTPEIGQSQVIRDLELPRLLDLEQESNFTLAVGSTVEAGGSAGSLDYSAPDRLLGQPPGTLQRLNQRRVARVEERAELANALARQRLARLRTEIENAGGVLVVDIQTRVPPVATAQDGDLVLRLRPPVDGERRPHRGGLEDLHRFLGELPLLIATAGAHAVRVRGGAHLSVACAIGAALPTTLVGTVEVVDTAGHTWVLPGQAPSPTGERLCEAVTPGGYNYGRGPVLAFIDLLPQQSDAAFDAMLRSGRPAFAGVLHLRPRTAGLLNPGDAEMLVGELNAEIRALANTHRTTEVHLLLRCPYSVAVLLGRTLNTLTINLYEWEDTPDGDSGPNPRYVPSIVLRSGSGGSPIDRITAPPLSCRS